VIKLAVTDMPGSGTPEELRAWARIDADAIVETVRDALGRGLEASSRQFHASRGRALAADPISIPR